jgi:hypothetical protein
LSAAIARLVVTRPNVDSGLAERVCQTYTPTTEATTTTARIAGGFIGSTKGDEVVVHAQDKREDRIHYAHEARSRTGLCWRPPLVQRSRFTMLDLKLGGRMLVEYLKLTVVR